MCNRCEKIDASIARYELVLAGVNDEAAISIVKRFSADQESEKRGAAHCGEHRQLPELLRPVINREHTQRKRPAPRRSTPRQWR
jgi:hypothetical protein